MQSPLSIIRMSFSKAGFPISSILGEENSVTFECTLHDIEKMIDRYVIARDRISGKDTFFTDCINHQIKLFKEDQERLKNSSEEGEEIKEFVRNYKYKIDEILNISYTGGYTSTSTSFF